MHFTRRGGVDGLEGHTLQVGHVEHRFGGHARTLHHSGWLQEDAGFPAARDRAEQRLVRREHLDHHKVWTLEDTLRLGGVCRWHQAEQRLDK